MALSVKTGTYTGNGGTSGTRAITGIGFQPKVVFVWSASTAHVSTPLFTIDTAIAGLGANYGMFGENGWVTTSADERFQSLDADGFTIVKQSGSNFLLNENGVVYYYLALGGTDVVTGNYTGNGSDNRNITGVGFQPIWVFMMGGANHNIMKFDSSGASTDGASFTYDTSDIANAIQALNADGFQVGTHATVNTNATVYYYFAVKSSTAIKQAEYTGNGSDNRNITGLGFTPEFVLVKSSGGYGFVVKNTDMSGDTSKALRSSGFLANYIQSLSSDTFQVGTANDVNANGSVFRYIAFTTVVAQSFTISETLALSETTTALRTRLTTTSETLALTETTTASRGFTAIIMDTLALSDIITTTRTFVVSILDTLALSEVLVDVKKKWETITKHTSEWTNTTKHTSEWTNRDKTP